ncbi:vWA domain-containing protein [Paenibacillus lautus]|uniref:VWA domain-containing protein n=1 Tax=Paenibacillus lautus TaxID=1401 RepID=A0A385THI7_PAELA|nr:vWA domain-containing protein [Paenibacillus lautus]AYB42042.1 VWA domain-containing protein [Paenibacillus lautus]
MQRKLNPLLLLLSLVGGGLGFAIGEFLLRQWGTGLPVIVVTGIYFGILALCIGLACLIAEMISPRLSGSSWRQRYTGTSWKLLIPSTLVALFLLGLLFEWVYQLNPGSAKPVKDIVLVIDNSGSMNETDPNQDRYTAAKNLINRMDRDNRVSVMVFDHATTLLQPFTRVKNQETKDEIIAEIDGLATTDGGTDISLALEDTMTHIQESHDAARSAMVIMLSDGFSETDHARVLADYKQQQIAVNTIGLSLVNPDGAQLLQTIAAETGGQYYDVQNAADLTFVFQKIYDDVGDRSLLTKRTGVMEDSVYYQIVRIVAMLLIGAAMGLALGTVFDNRHLALSFSIGGAVSGVLAGVVLEYGLSGEEIGDASVRLIACLLLAGIIALFTLVIPVKESSKIIRNVQRPGRTGRGQRENDSTSRGF